MKKEPGKIETNVILIFRDEATGKTRTVEAKNLVTDAGDEYYAQRAVEFVLGAPTADNIFDTLFIGAGPSPAASTKTDDFSDLSPLITGATALVTTTWPKTDDQDILNAGGDVDAISWKFEFTPASFEAPGTPSIEVLGIAAAAATGTDPILNRLVIPAETKTFGQSLTVFINHTLNGIP